MFDPASMSGALGSIKTIYDLLKNAHDGELAVKISSEVSKVQAKLIDVQQQTIEIQEDNKQLRAELERFRTHVQHHSVCWRRRPDGTEDGPFCPVCDGEGREMRLILRPHADQTREYHLYCPELHAGVGDKNRPYIPPAPEPTYTIPRTWFPKTTSMCGSRFRQLQGNLTSGWTWRNAATWAK